MSYVGSDNGSNPDLAGAFDMLSVLRHEFGHVLGMTGHNRCADETSDDDYDFSGALVGGYSAAVRTAEHITADSADRYHVAPSNSLMFPNIGTGTRRGISATDVFSIVSASDWNAGDVHLNRIDFLGGNDWFTPGFWEGGQVPNSVNHVAIRTQASTHSITLNGHAEAWTLLISDGNEILTGNRSLSVFGHLTMEGEATHVDIQSGGTLMIRVDTSPADEFNIVGNGRLTIRSGGELDLSEAGHDVSLTELTVESGANDVDIPHDLYLHRGMTVGTGVNVAVGNNLAAGESNSMVSNITEATIDVMNDVDLHSGTLHLINSTLYIAHHLTIGESDDAAILLDGSTLRAEYMFLGFASGTSSDIVMDAHGGEDPALITTGTGITRIYVGFHGSATLHQLAGTIGRATTADIHPDMIVGYSSGSNSHYVIEGGSATVQNMEVGNGGEGFVLQNNGIVTVLGELAFGGTGGLYDSSYTINNGTVTIGELSHDGSGSKFNINGGTLILTGPTHAIDQFSIGEWANSDGKFTLSGREMTVNQLTIGREGLGMFTMAEDSVLVAHDVAIGVASHATYFNTMLINNGETTISGTMTLGVEPGSTGKLVLSAGDPEIVVTTNSVLVGDQGTGVIHHYGGLHNVGDLVIGGGGDGTYKLSGGELRAESTIVGDGGHAEFRHIEGLHDVTELWVNTVSDPILGGGYLLFAAGTLKATQQYIGDQSDGFFQQQGGSSTTAVNVYLGYRNSRIGLVEQTGGSNAIDSDLYIAYAWDSTGSYRLGGGTEPGITQQIDGNLYIGWGVDSDGTYTIVGKVYHVGSGWTYQGELTVGGATFIGGSGPGQMDIEPAGTFTANGPVLVGGVSIGALNLDGGTVSGDGDMTIYGNGTLAGRGRIEIPINNYGTIEVPEGNSLTCTGGLNLDATGTATIGEWGTLELDGGGTLAGTFVNRGQLRIYGGTYLLNTPLDGAGGTDGSVAVSGELHINAGVTASNIAVWGGTLYIQHDVDAGWMDLQYGAIDQSPGNVQTGSLTIMNGSYHLAGPGNLSADDVKLFGTFTHDAGTHTANTLRVGGENYGYMLPGTYTISGGRLEVVDMFIGEAGVDDPFPTPDVPGTFEITDASAEVYVAGRLVLSPETTLNLVPGATIHMTGSTFDNLSQNEIGLADLANLELIFEGGAGVKDTFEVASAPGGGWVENFALGTLTIGGMDLGHLQLVDRIDNGNRSDGAEVLVMSALNILPLSSLDLAGLGLDLAGNVTGDLLAMIGDGRLIDSMMASAQWLEVIYEGGLDRTGLLRVSEPGDFDLDGDVDPADLVIWQTGFGICTSLNEGDADGDADVDGADFLIWQRHYDPAAAGSTASQTVPEPSAYLLITIAIVLIGTMRLKDVEQFLNRGMPTQTWRHQLPDTESASHFELPFHATEILAYRDQ